MTCISATSVLASKHWQTGKRIDTLLLRYPRSVHSELMTHRVFSRNAASSRAIPVKKLIADVLENPFVPVFWGRNEPGMQASIELTGRELEEAKELWTHAMQSAVLHATALADTGAHKQIVNRILEPFAHITVLVTSTTWTNFLALRDHKDAEPHIAILAREVRKVLEGAEVQTLRPGQWHLPFVTENDKDGICFDAGAGADGTPKFIELATKLSVARCASTSYKTVEGFDMTQERAVALYEKLVTADLLHASPLEHQATPDEWMSSGDFGAGHWLRGKHLHGNFDGFVQLRKTIPNENIT